MDKERTMVYHSIRYNGNASETTWSAVRRNNAGRIMPPIRILFSIALRFYKRRLGEIASIYKRLRASQSFNAGTNGADATRRDVEMSTRDHLREVIKRMRSNKIEHPSYLWECHFNYGIESCMYECLKQIQKIEKDERAANTSKKNKRA